MARRRSSRPDSLELLLDTICNTFGGVLFIAILVVLLLQQTGGSPDAAETPPIVPVSPVELQELVLRLEAASADLERLRKNRDSQAGVVQDFAPEAIREQIVRRRELTSRLEMLQGQVDDLLKENTDLMVEARTLADKNSQVQKELDEALAEQQQVTADLERDRQARVEEIRLPVSRSGQGKQEIGLILRYGRLYLWHRYGPGQVRLGLNTDDFVVVSEDEDGLWTHPKPTRGVPLDGSPVSQEKVRQVLRQFDKSSCYLTVVVRPDSYAAFKHLRDRAIELGFEYRLMPSTADSPVRDRGGRGGSVQ